MTDRPSTWPIIYLLLWELKLYYRVQKGRLLKPALSQLSLLKSRHCDEVLLRVILFGPAHCYGLLKSPCFWRFFYIRLQMYRIFFLVLDILRSDTVLKCQDGQSTEY